MAPLRVDRRATFAGFDRDERWKVLGAGIGVAGLDEVFDNESTAAHAADEFFPGVEEFERAVRFVALRERTFVVRIKGDGSVEWVNVSRGARVGDLVEVFGALKEGDTIARRGTDELRQGSKVKIQPPKTT